MLMLFKFCLVPPSKLVPIGQDNQRDSDVNSKKGLPKIRKKNKRHQWRAPKQLMDGCLKGRGRGVQIKMM